ncbi:transcription termination factor NusA [Paraconexibacter sp.]|uniref:transcription termination factor NusA n=1 Tax=Paraconexibacter sp. TaxID=2949640 RepID=UPI00356504BD
MSREIIEAMRGLAAEKNISDEKLMVALEDALLSAYKKLPGAARYARVDVDPETGDFIVMRYRIPKDLEQELLVQTVEEESYIDPETGERVEPADPEIDAAKFEQFRDQIREVDDTPEDFGRIAAQTAKQVILQRIREAERDMMFEEYRDRVGELVTGIVQQKDSRYTLIQLRERVEALLPKSEQVDGERYEHNQRVKAVIKEVSNSTKGPSIIVSRRDADLIKALFELEVPEIADGLVEIAGVAREPGYRSKIAVVSHADGVDPVGACVGPRGSRVRMVVSELRGEKIDIIPYNDEPARFVAKALSPARVREVIVDDEARQATVIVPDDQLSLAIGREGQNARLAARLTGWRIDIRSETDFANVADEPGFEEQQEAGGRCAAVLTNGRRCPNAALGGSPYCGLPMHQALSRFTTSSVAVLTGLTDDEITALSDPDKSQDDVAAIVVQAEAAHADLLAAGEPVVAEDGPESGDGESGEPTSGDDGAADDTAAAEGEVPSAEVPADPEPAVAATEQPAAEQPAEEPAAETAEEPVAAEDPEEQTAPPSEPAEEPLAETTPAPEGEGSPS